MTGRSLGGRAAAVLGAACVPAWAVAGEADEVRAVVAEMLAEAATHSSLLAGGGGDAGHDGKFFIAGDGFRLNLGAVLQFRYYMDFRDDSAGDDFDSGFRTRRAKLQANGTLGKGWDFGFQGDFSTAGNLVLDDMWAQYSFQNGLKIKAGQFKLPLLREELISDFMQLCVERSIVNSAYTQARSQGLQLALSRETWRCAAALSDGLNSRNTDFVGDDESTGGFKVSGEADWALTGRVECLLGEGAAWKRFDDFTSPPGGALAWLLGAAAHYQQSENSPDPTDVDRDTFEYTGDVAVEGDGWNAYGQFVGRYTEQRFAGGASEFNDFGALIHAGVYISEKAELFARWEALFIDSDRFAAGTDEPDSFHFLDAGVNYYFAGHAARFTADAVWAFNDTSRLRALGILPDTGIGLQGQAEENEVVVRAQFQFMF